MPYKDWNTVNQPARSERQEISDAVWEEHKELILREFQNGKSYAKVESWIEDQHIPDFRPSAAQLRNFKRKYGAVTQDSRSNVEAESFVVAEHADIVHDLDRTAGGNDSIRFCLPKESSESFFYKRPLSFDGFRDLPPGKRARNESTFLTQSSPEGSRENTPPESVSSPPSFVTHVTELFPEPEYPSLSHEDLPIQEHFSQDSLTAHGVEPDALEDRCSFQRHHAYNVTIHFPDYDTLNQELDLQAIQQTADMFLASGMEAEACRWYLLLGEAFQKIPDPPKDELLLALIGASRCAASLHERSTVQEAIQSVLQSIKSAHPVLAETLMLEALAVHSEIRLGNDTGALNLLNYYIDGRASCPRFLRTMEAMLDGYHQDYEEFISNIYIAIYFMPCRLFELVQTFPYSKDFAHQSELNGVDRSNSIRLTAKLIGPSCTDHCSIVDCNWASSFNMRTLAVELRKTTRPWLPSTKALRQCIAWIQAQLNSVDASLLSIKRLRYRFALYRESDVAVIFCFLWIPWLETDDNLFWENKVDQPGCGRISDLETLRLITSLILAAPDATDLSTQGRSDGNRAFMDKDYDLLQRAIEGASRLSTKPDSELARLFIQGLKDNLERCAPQPWEPLKRRSRQRWLSFQRRTPQTSFPHPPRSRTPQSSLPPKQRTLPFLLPLEMCRTFADAVLDTDSHILGENLTILPYTITLSPRDPSIARSRSQSRAAAKLAQDLMPKSVSMLAPSLCSSDLSSMRRIATQRRGSAWSLASWRTPSLMDQLSNRLSLFSIVEPTSVRSSVHSRASAVLEDGCDAATKHVTTNVTEAVHGRAEDSIRTKTAVV